MSDSPHIILLGATGYVGGHILRKLVATRQPGSRLIILVRTLPDEKIEGVEYVVGSLPEQIPADLLPDEDHIIIHFGTLQISRDETLYHAVNVVGAEQLLELCNAHTLGIIYGSSMSVYGQGSQRNQRESEPVRPDTALARARAAVEERILQTAGEKNFSAYCLRPRFILGEGDRYVLPAFARMLQQRVRIGSGGQCYSFIEVNDYAGIVLALISIVAQNHHRATPEQVALNIGYHHPVSCNQLLKILSHQLDQPGRRFKLQVPITIYLAVLGLLPVANKGSRKTVAELIGRDHWGSVERLERIVGTEIVGKDPRQVIKALAAEL
jgi:nucleoside-diphosphate-sugar epimerase